MNLDVTLLRTFLVLADELHFARAAEQCNLDQSAVSRQIRQLEKRLGVTLFDRSTRRVELTSHGHALLGSAREVIDSYERLLTDAKGEARAERREVRIGFMMHAAGAELTEVLREVRRRIPDLTVTLHEGNWRETSAGVRSGETDVSVVLAPLDTRGLVAEQIRALPVYLFVSPAHPLAVRDEVRVADLLGETWLTAPEDDPVYHEFWTFHEARGGAPFRAGAAVDTPEAGVLRLISADVIGFGASVRSLSMFEGLRLVPIVDAPPCQVVLVRRDAPLRREVEVTLDVMREILTVA